MKFLSDPIAFACMLVFGSVVLYFLFKKEKARKEAERAAGSSTPAADLDFTKPGRRTTSPPKAEETGEDSMSRRRASGRGLPVPPSNSGPAGGRGGAGGGFREQRWGTPPPAEMVSYHEAGDTVLFVRTGDVLKLGDGQLTSILYSYWRGRLEAVIVEMPDTSVDRVMAKLVQDWGEPKRPPGSVTKFFWTEIGAGEMATQAMLEKLPLARKATLTVASKSIKAERAREATGSRSVR